jgi:hypothetical protein
MTVLTLAALTVLVVLDWIAVGMLTQVIRKARTQGIDIPAANDRRRAATAIAIGSSLILLLSLNSQFGRIVSGDVLVVVLVVAILVPSLANALFILDVLRGVYR